MFNTVVREATEKRQQDSNVAKERNSGLLPDFSCSRLCSPGMDHLTSVLPMKGARCCSLNVDYQLLLLYRTTITELPSLVVL